MFSIPAIDYLLKNVGMSGGKPTTLPLSVENDQKSAENS
jgi:hypothetical protein